MSRDTALREWQDANFQRIFDLIPVCPSCHCDEQRYCRQCKEVYCRVCVNDRGEYCVKCHTIYSLISRPAIPSHLEPWRDELDEWIAEHPVAGESEGVTPHTPSGNEKFYVGQRVTAFFHGGPQAYPGTIDAIDGCGTYSVAYDDGDYETAVPEERITAQGGGETFSVGQRVKALWRGGAQAFPGRISAVAPNGSYSIAYDDGDSEEGVPPERISKAEASVPAEKLTAGVRVNAAFKGSPVKYPGVIEKSNGDGSFAVKFDDGDYDGNVPLSGIALALV